MNNNIKIFIIILIFTSKIYASEFVITIPEKFGSSELPLPPFPMEVINNLDEKDYYIDLLNSNNVRDIELTTIDYIYYPEFLSFTLNDIGMIFHEGEVYSDFSGVKLSYRPGYFSNSLSLYGDLSFNSENTLLDIKAEYREYRLPIDLTAKGALENKALSLTLGQVDYYKLWSISSGLKDSLPFISMDYRDNRLFKPYISLNYQNPEEKSGIAALGWKHFRVGASLVGLDLYPYFQFNKRFDSLNINFDTLIDDDVIDYSFYITLNNLKLLKIGIGSIISDQYSNYTPYISLREGLLLGFREYTLTQSDIEFKWSFIKDQFTSIISLKYLFDGSDFNMDILINYKVGQL